MAASTLDARAAIVSVGRWLDSKGWAPATAGNYSMRLNDGSFAGTVSGPPKGRLTAGASGAPPPGRHKGRLTEHDVMRVDAAGHALDGKKPSAETALHLALY